ncbi:MAG: hypothetical protein FJX74_18380, partial [Armatimonadetes bacterium]|nr:hypothetical protein [Armatimonadota bacterium]
NRLAEQLKRDGIEADAIHGNKRQNARTRALKQFKDGELRVLVATDIAARGLDIRSVSHVINYDMPNTVDDYIHRIGRTGRAEQSGDALTLVTADDHATVQDIERVLGTGIPVRRIEGFDYGMPSVTSSGSGAARTPTSYRSRPKGPSYGGRRRSRPGAVRVAASR